jgi:glycogen debranching enzyme
VLHSHAYDDAPIAEHHPFRVKDVFFSALLAAADDALAALAPVAGIGPETMVELSREADRTRGAIDDRFDPDTGLAHDLDLVTGEALPARTIAGFAPLVAGGLFARAPEMVATLTGPSFCGAEGMRWPLPPSTAVDDPAFDPRSYWRGPVWPVMTWILWWSLRRAGANGTAGHLRDEALAQLEGAGLFEYIDPGTGEGLGSDAQSWTAAVALDWLADRAGQPARGWVDSGSSR